MERPRRGACLGCSRNSRKACVAGSREHRESSEWD